MDALCEPNFGSAMFFAPVVLNALTTRAPVAQAATCSPAEVVWPRTKRNPSGPIVNGFVASIRIFPLRLPAACSALCAPSQGVARTTTEASFTASAIVAARVLLPASRNSFFTFSSPGFLTPNVTTCPFFAQRAPRVPPTLPAPMIAIFIVLGSPLCSLQERHQVGQFLAAELFVQSGRHDGDRPRAHLSDLRSGDPHFGVETGRQQHFVRRVAADHAAVFIAGFGHHDHRLVTAHKAGARINDGLEEIAFGSRLANIRQVRT